MLFSLAFIEFLLSNSIQLRCIRMLGLGFEFTILVSIKYFIFHI
jgi:hypothetical protein